jgi:DNA-binding LacI/PurR family transcriptional regulator
MADIHDVAKAAGVSASTVSNVINGRHNKMRDRTLQRVLDAIETLKYTPNSAARQLKSGQIATIGLIVPSVANPFWGSVAHHVERAAVKSGFRVMICNAGRDPAVEAQYAEALLGSGITGVILGSSPITFAHLRDLAERGLKIAAFDRAVEGAENVVSCSVTVDQELGGSQAAQHLIGLGHKRIAIVSGPVRTISRIGRVRGVRKAMERAGLELAEEYIWQGGDLSGFGDMEGAELGRTGVRELLSRGDPPTGIVAVNDMYALGAYAGARDLGYSVPDDLSVVGFDDIVLSEIAQPALTTIRQPVPVMADAIVEALIRSIQGKTDEDGRSHVNITPQLIVRGSTAAPNRGVRS